MRYHTEQFALAVGNSKVRYRTRAALLAIFSTCIAAGVWGGLNWEGRRQDGARAGVATSAGLRQAGFKPARDASFTPCEPNSMSLSPLPLGEGQGEGMRVPSALSYFNSSTGSDSIRLCQALGPAAPCPICAVDCSQCCSYRRCGGWEMARLIDWQAYAQGEYVGHARLAHVPEYRLRVDDQIDMTYRLTREETPDPYKLNVGDEIRVESFTDPDLNRDLLIQPDGTITLRLLGQVHATGRTVTQLTDALDELYKKYYKVPSITVTPLKVNTKLEDLRATVDRRAGIGGQSQSVRVTPEGTVSLPAIGSVRAQGLTLTEFQDEINERYRQDIEGIQIIPILSQRAPRFVYVLGEVKTPGRFELTGPTTALQAISMAGSWNVGANLRQIVVFRRGDDWRLMATMINLEGALFGRTPCPKGEIWIDDSDVIIVPKGPILQADDFIDLVFTRGIYGVFPLVANLNFIKASTL
ncbi:MAG: polysaccharide biosynthesis/export family protein [Thermoguttaceae bacterium]